jgi:hypothetical protein
MGFRLINGFLLGICHESYPEADAWAILLTLALWKLSLARTLPFTTKTKNK